MNPISLLDLATQVRLESGLRNNQSITDQQIMTFLGEAYSDLRDRMIVRFAYWFREEVEFTLAGGTDGYIFDLSTLPDFQMAQGLDLTVSPGVFASIPMLGSYAERNAMNGTWPYVGMGCGYNGTLGRKYWIDGDNLEVLPAQNAGGDYRLVYTPIQQLANTLLSSNFTLASGDNFSDRGGYLGFVISAVTTDSTMLGGTITVNFTGSDAAINGTYAISPSTPLGGSLIITTTPTPPGIVWSGPASGAGSIGINGPGSVYLLPVKLNPWSQYLVLYAAIAVRNLREQDTTALLVRFADIKQRVIDLTKQRSEGIRQAPITNNRYGRSGMSGPGGW